MPLTDAIDELCSPFAAQVYLAGGSMEGRDCFVKQAAGGKSRINRVQPSLKLFAEGLQPPGIVGCLLEALVYEALESVLDGSEVGGEYESCYDDGSIRFLAGEGHKQLLHKSNCGRVEACQNA